nr:MAG TPA: hypothetical protein [Caudoviricetes sp.]
MKFLCLSVLMKRIKTCFKSHSGAVLFWSGFFAYHNLYSL